MSLMKMLLIVVVIGVIAGLIAAYTGAMNMDKDGNVTFEKVNMETSDMTKADLLAAQAKPMEAIPLYESYLAKNPKAADAPEAKFRIGKCYEDAKQESWAIKAYKTYLKEFPNDSVDRKNRANQRISFLENAGFKEAK